MIFAEGVRAYTESVGPILGPLYRLIARLTFASPASGALGTIFCTASPIPRAEPIKYRGAYLSPPCAIDRTSRLVERKELLTELWDTTERLLRDDIGLDLPTV